MRNISGMPSDDMAGGALRRVPIPKGRMTAVLACLWRGVLNSYYFSINFKKFCPIIVFAYAKTTFSGDQRPHTPPNL